MDSVTSALAYNTLYSYLFFLDFSIFVLVFFFYWSGHHRDLHSFPTRRSSDLLVGGLAHAIERVVGARRHVGRRQRARSEEHTSELQSHHDLVCRLLLEKKKKKTTITNTTRI